MARDDEEVDAPPTSPPIQPVPASPRTDDALAFSVVLNSMDDCKRSSTTRLSSGDAHRASGQINVCKHTHTQQKSFQFIIRTETFSLYEYYTKRKHVQIMV